MASTAHMDSLSRRHEELEAAIAAEIKHPAFDELRVVELKRKKLKIKEKLEGLDAKTQPN